MGPTMDPGAAATVLADEAVDEAGEADQVAEVEHDPAVVERVGEEAVAQGSAWPSHRRMMSL